VCSSDLFDYSVLSTEFNRFGPKSVSALANIASVDTRTQLAALMGGLNEPMAINIVLTLAQSNEPDDRRLAARSEERRVGKEGRGGWAPDQYKNRKERTERGMWEE